MPEIGRTQRLRQTHQPIVGISVYNYRYYLGLLFREQLRCIRRQGIQLAIIGNL